MTPIPPPNFFAFLMFDPNRPGTPPYWDKPQNAPPANLAAIMAALPVSSLIALAAQLTPYMGSGSGSGSGSGGTVGITWIDVGREEKSGG